MELNEQDSKDIFAEDYEVAVDKLWILFKEKKLNPYNNIY